MTIPLAALVALTVGPQDGAGRWTVEFAPGPREVYMAGPKAGAIREEHILPLPPGEVCEVRSFVGWDRGSIGEANLELNVGGRRLYERSEHKESPQDYDAWKSRRVMGEVGVGELLHYVQAAWMTGPNAHDRGLSTRVEFSIRVVMAQERGGCD